MCVYVCVCVCVCVRAWIQLASLFGFSVKQITRAAHLAVVRGMSTSPHECARSVRFLYNIVHYLPMMKCRAIKFCLQWLKINAHWRGNQYSSWTTPDSLSPDGVAGAWSDDWQILHHEAETATPPDHHCCHVSHA